MLVVLAGCSNPPKKEDAGGTVPTEGSAALSGAIAIDGSSTVFPITEAVAEEFQKKHPQVRVTVGQSGTGGGFKKFLNNETAISNASRPIKSSEAEEAKQKGIEYIELPIAYDGLSVVVHPSNTWVETLTVAELKKIWEPESKVNNWSQVRAGFPDRPLKLYGAGTDSGTFDYFTEAINGKEDASRPDYTASEDDNMLVQGVSGDPGALGYFGYAYFEANQDKLKLVAIDNGQGGVKPSPETINNGSYQPLSRPLFIYVRKDAAEKPEVQAFIKFYLTEGRKLVKDAGYIPLPDRAYELAQERFDKRITGSVFAGGSQVGVKIEDLLSKEAATP
jgi:phosphate transport system substrate-binding protein